MRTTVSIDDDVMEAARYLAEQKKVAIGKILSDLARKGLQNKSEISSRNGFPVFKVPNDAVTITPHHVKQLEDIE